MSRLISAPLDVDQFQTVKGGERVFELAVWSYWYDNGYPVESIEEAHTVIHEKDDEENSSHIVCKVQTLEVPINVADVVADQTTKWVCDCKRFQYQEGVDLEERRLTDWGNCHHIQAVSRTARANADEDQDTLV